MKKNIYILLLSIFFISCHYKIENYPSLINQGIIPVSKEQAFVGANLFLSNEMEKSSYLYNFLKEQGAPDAIEIVSNSFNNDKFYMYYYHAKEVYIADPKKQDDNVEWIIKGPKVPNWRDLKNIRNIMDSSENDAPFFINGNKEFFPRNKSAIKDVLPKITETNISIPKIDLSKLPKVPPKKNITRRKYVAPKRRITIPKTTPKKNELVTTTTKNLEIVKENLDFLSSLENLKSYAPINSDQMAIAISKGYANRDNFGNVLHNVKSYTETLQAIAFWYTGNEINAIEIEKFNDLTDASNLKIGQTIIIPFNMLKQVKQMPN